MGSAAVHILLGGIGPGFFILTDGWDAPLTSEGMLQLVPQLSTIPGVKVTTQDWGDFQKVVDAIAATDKDTKTAVIGFSGGGSRATWVANSPANKAWPRIDLLVGYDPSPASQVMPLHANVKKSICYYNTRPLMAGLGGGLYTAAPTWGCKTLLTRTIAEQHMRVQYDQLLHSATVRAVKDMMKGA